MFFSADAKKEKLRHTIIIIIINLIGNSMKAIFLTLFISMMIVSCSTHPVNTSHHNGPKIKEVQTGKVISIKKTTIAGQRSSIGGRVGSTAGRIAGGAIGSGYGSVLGSIVGSVIGGAVGSGIDNRTKKIPALELLVKLDDGQQVTVTQPVKTLFKLGDEVKLVMKQGQVSVVPIHP